jgi:predicted NACHT family NTPase
MLKERFREKGGMVLFDGLDEIPDPDQSCPRLKAVIEDMATCYPKCRIVVTSRPYAYQNPKWQLREFAQATLAPFSEGQIKQFIQGWYGYLRHYYKWSEEIQQARAQQLDQAIFSRHRQMRSLAERPLLLTLMVNLHAKTGRLPEKRAELYEETVKLLLDRWERGRLGQTGAITKSLSEYLETNQDDIRRLLDSLAYEAHAHQPQNVGDTANLDGFKLLNGLMKLTLKKIDTNELLGYLNDRAGILENVAEGIYRFPHRTFQEYMAASYLTSRDDFAAETAELVRRDTNRWREVALLAGAKASSGMAGAVWQLVDELCVEEAAGPGAAPADLMAGLIAGQAILESANLNQVSPAGKKKIKRVKGWLEALMVSRLPVLERVTAGQVLAKLGDERKGVGVRVKA